MPKLTSKTPDTNVILSGSFLYRKLKQLTFYYIPHEESLRNDAVFRSGVLIMARLSSHRNFALIRFSGGPESCQLNKIYASRISDHSGEHAAAAISKHGVIGARNLAWST